MFLYDKIVIVLKDSLEMIGQAYLTKKGYSRLL